MYKKITMALAIAAILTTYIEALTLSNQAFAQPGQTRLLPGQDGSSGDSYDGGVGGGGAKRDWNFDRFPPESGGDNSCPHATEHTSEYCNGYAKGYTYEWNTLYQGQQTPTGRSPDTREFLCYIPQIKNLLPLHVIWSL
jgi:hypothetical protein